MSKVFLFDWGDTLMVDVPNQPGHMKDWPDIYEVNGAKEALRKLSQFAKIYVATGSIGTTENLMQDAFERTSFSDCLSGYFCPNNIGFEKPSKDFYLKIAQSINCKIKDITMVGDNLQRDILPALDVGMAAIWLNSNNQENESHVRQINDLTKLC